MMSQVNRVREIACA